MLGLSASFPRVFLFLAVESNYYYWLNIISLPQFNHYKAFFHINSNLVMQKSPVMTPKSMKLSNKNICSILVIAIAGASKYLQQYSCMRDFLKISSVAKSKSNFLHDSSSECIYYIFSDSSPSDVSEQSLVELRRQPQSVHFQVRIHSI